jgi:hypothetical protein
MPDCDFLTGGPSVAESGLKKAKVSENKTIVLIEVSLLIESEADYFVSVQDDFCALR